MGGYITSSPCSQTFGHRLELQPSALLGPSLPTADLEVSTSLSIYLPTYLPTYKGFPGGSDVKESACNAGDPGSIPG